MESPLDQSVASIHPYAKRLAAPLKRLGIATVRDLLLYTPTRHEDLRAIVPIRDLRAGQRVVIRGRIMTIANRRSPRRRMFITEALIGDATGAMRAVWFQQPYLAHAFRPGAAVIVAGAVESDAYGIHLTSPILERDRGETLHAGRLVPVYPLTSGISQKQLRFLIHAALPFSVQLEESLPEEVRERERLLRIREAVREIHFPSDPTALERARERFAFEEAFTYFLRVRASRQELDYAAAPTITRDEKVTVDFLRHLPFLLTAAQERTTEEVLGDLGRHRPMQRLLNGDVGSGKTIVAAIAAAHVARAGFQTAYLAPTEVLAVQQAEKFVQWLAPLGIHVALWTRTSRMIDGAAVELRALRAAVQRGTIGVVIGTHAILSESVHFKALGFAIIDEQHRFGVEQRAALRAKANTQMNADLRNIRDVGVHSRIRAPEQLMPHLLSMTATPIPRTLNLSMLGDLDVSVLDELPAGRKPVRTVVISPRDRLAMTREIREEIDHGHQVFIVCPQIDAEEGGARGGYEAVAVAEAYERAQRAFPDVSIGALHGRMRRDAQRAIMEEYASRRLAMLVSTTVIEVGVDQPNATVMVVEDAERFGLAQLHQLRGRVGRGDAGGICFLTTRSDDPAVLVRLRRVADCTDGFRLAEIDLEERGPGAIIGTAQSGWPAFRYAVISTDCCRRAQAAAAAYAAQSSARVCAPTTHLE